MGDNEDVNELSQVRYGVISEPGCVHEPNESSPGDR